jgi:uncharacterized protein YjbI with pentapeptide repeats
MSEQQIPSPPAEQVNEPDGSKPDDSEPTLERQAELRAVYEANVAAGNAPYEGVEIRTQGEVNWILHERNWSSESLFPEEYEEERIDLRGVSFDRTNLSGVHLDGAYLSNASFNLTDLSGAGLSSTDLSGAFLGMVNARKAQFGGANLSGVDLSGQISVGPITEWRT